VRVKFQQQKSYAPWPSEKARRLLEGVVQITRSAFMEGREQLHNGSSVSASCVIEGLHVQEQAAATVSGGSSDSVISPAAAKASGGSSDSVISPQTLLPEEINLVVTLMSGDMLKISSTRHCDMRSVKLQIEIVEGTPATRQSIYLADGVREDEIGDNETLAEINPGLSDLVPPVLCPATVGLLMVKDQRLDLCFAPVNSQNFSLENKCLRATMKWEDEEALAPDTANIFGSRSFSAVDPPGETVKTNAKKNTLDWHNQLLASVAHPLVLLHLPSITYCLMDCAASSVVGNPSG
jgi:hypothetical protein